MSGMIRVTCSAPVNIAVLKYWGKRDENLILPINSSISATLNQRDLKTTTTIVASKDFKEDRMWLNGKEESISAKRLQNCLRLVKERAQDRHDENGQVVVKKEDWDLYKIYIYSTNNFPTAAGLASSASGFACLVYTLSQLYCVKEEYPGELTTIARMGSGSACRSLDGGFVKWEMGTQEDGSDSRAIQIVDENHWSDIVILILVVSAEKKHIGSTPGMQVSVETSEFLRYRAETIVPKRVHEFEKAIIEKDFQEFGRLTMIDSNQFHSTCLDTYPPIFYLNDTSRTIINVLTKFNEYHKSIKAAYTFDAGPNAVIYTTKDNVECIKELIGHYFPIGEQQGELDGSLKEFINTSPLTNSIERVIETDVGSGPKLASEDGHPESFVEWKKTHLN